MEIRSQKHILESAKGNKSLYKKIAESVDSLLFAVLLTPMKPIELLDFLSQISDLYGFL